ncbi:TPA: hypothetical protein JZG64_002518 [Escherichia coli]|nr:hypothetical protein [Escherichia coli]HAX5184852.1 hypothetical protein [Escherichia coli]HAX5231330.1 hypothetical protein [Escherichia coli]HAX5272914.1 hypothetical protein [Escherichia coli]
MKKHEAGWLLLVRGICPGLRKLLMMDIFYGVLIGCFCWLNWHETLPVKKGLILVCASIMSFVFGVMAAHGWQ